MTLLARCALLRERIEWSRKLDSMRYAAAKLAERRDWIDSTRRKVRLALERGSTLRGGGVPLLLPATHASVVACQDATIALRGKAGAEGSEAVLDDEAWRRLTKAVEQDAISLESHVRSTLDEVREGVRALPLEGMQGIAIAAGKESEFRELTRLKASLIGASWYEKPAADLRQLLSQAGALRRGIEELGDIGAPDEVKRFLDSARDGKATIAALTPSVRQWLDDKGLLGNLRITLGSK